MKPTVIDFSSSLNAAFKKLSSKMSKTDASYFKKHVSASVDIGSKGGKKDVAMSQLIILAKRFGIEVESRG